MWYSPGMPGGVLLLLALPLALLAAASPAAAAASPGLPRPLLTGPRGADATLVRTSGGLVRGRSHASGVTAFFGVPYAAQPVGARRFRPPAPVEAWAGVLDAERRDITATACPQLDVASQNLFGREDCLTVDVWVPPGTAAGGARGRPVMVYIHGGAFWLGDQLDYGLHDAGVLARDTGHVVVLVQYRLGVFGFFAAGALRAEDPGGSTGNYGCAFRPSTARTAADTPSFPCPQVAGPAGGPALGAGQRRRVRGRPQQRHHLRGERGGDVGVRAGREPGGGRPVPPGDRAERQLRLGLRFRSAGCRARQGRPLRCHIGVPGRRRRGAGPAVPAGQDDRGADGPRHVPRGGGGGGGGGRGHPEPQPAAGARPPVDADGGRQLPHGHAPGDDPDRSVQQGSFHHGQCQGRGLALCFGAALRGQAPRRRLVRGEDAAAGAGAAVAAGGRGRGAAGIRREELLQQLRARQRPHHELHVRVLLPPDGPGDAAAGGAGVAVR